ncbi:hypothetical protein RHMOL_Rhmol05G0205600 [Rhododendron molle]|uniref:Uncharacterized protein n=1 Tax=Rhododendron molle TaxID=49168 RepID=A0ACC0NSK8_RHOML|nr:hypothetical protein RHMOL_Rhmol05G0205600 [Rhododendron molle]
MISIFGVLSDRDLCGDVSLSLCSSPSQLNYFLKLKWILLLCKYGSYSLVVKVIEGYQFEDLIGSISNKWNGLVSMRLLYSVCDHLKILLENDDDFRTMKDLAAAYGARCVVVSVEDGNCRVSSRFEIDESSRSNGNGGVTSSSHSEIIEVPLEKFCPLS